jgi:hypothetical protein
VASEKPVLWLWGEGKPCTSRQKPIFRAILDFSVLNFLHNGPQLLRLPAKRRKVISVETAMQSQEQ